MPQAVESAQPASLEHCLRLLLLHARLRQQRAADVAEGVPLPQQAARHAHELDDEDRADESRSQIDDGDAGFADVDTHSGDAHRQEHHRRDLGVAHEAPHQGRRPEIAPARLAHGLRHLVPRLEPIHRRRLETPIYDPREPAWHLRPDRLDSGCR